MVVDKLPWAHNKVHLMQLICEHVIFYFYNQSNKQTSTHTTHIHVQYIGTLMYRVLHAPTHTCNSHSIYIYILNDWRIWTFILHTPKECCHQVQIMALTWERRRKRVKKRDFLLLLLPRWLYKTIFPPSNWNERSMKSILCKN